MKDVELIKRCQSGDINAFELLVERFGAQAVRTAYLVTGRQDLAEDIAQETFIQCFYSIKQLKKAEFFKTWFYKILLRTGRKMAAKNRRLLQIDNLDNNFNAVQLHHYDLEEAFEKNEAKEAVYQAVSTLSEPLKVVITLRYFNDFSISEIASVLGCKEGTVKSRLHNARKLIAAFLQEKGLNTASSEDNQSRKECILNV
ncbi:RNA polymerase sigma-70 factor, ECF subfamily [Desulfofundulus australicus DSM 11792]|uniref:RNA polymerase sigma-70 factor, ECF subfamily n=1 Tax=Desulfofundulus australicus DSM 11792 TaxID=1121425 RepID=A0A1M5APX7_9FIRM|nr:sigma-70 family RNA polymerase sigma factor [Desulfofundulus australicus]SHF32235.1 RNA polymerase sigma-70 factor, ECF subfamily [Desulfofundulus australicus DSM 11792]